MDIKQIQKIPELRIEDADGSKLDVITRRGYVIAVVSDGNEISAIIMNVNNMIKLRNILNRHIERDTMNEQYRT